MEEAKGMKTVMSLQEVTML